MITTDALYLERNFLHEESQWVKVSSEVLLLQSRQSDTAGWECTYKKPSTSSDYQRSSWNCKHFFRNNPIPKWTAMKEEAEPEGAKGLQHIRKTIILENL